MAGKAHKTACPKRCASFLLSCCCRGGGNVRRQDVADVFQQHFVFMAHFQLSVSSSYVLSRWSSMLRLLCPVANTVSLPPVRFHGFFYCCIGSWCLSTMGSISFGFVWWQAGSVFPSLATEENGFRMGCILFPFVLFWCLRGEFVWRVRRSACARWLSRFLTSGSNSAAYFAVSGQIKNTGRNWNRFPPRRNAVPLFRAHTRFWQWSDAGRLYGGQKPIRGRSNSFCRLLAYKFGGRISGCWRYRIWDCSFGWRAECMPGAPFKVAGTGAAVVGECGQPAVSGGVPGFFASAFSAKAGIGVREHLGYVELGLRSNMVMPYGLNRLPNFFDFALRCRLPKRFFRFFQT